MFDYDDPEMEKLRAQNRDKKQRGQRDITVLYSELESLLDHPAPATTLDRQADILDQIFTSLMRQNITRDKDNGYINQSALEFALKVQKQCNDTLKTRAAIDYMQNIVKSEAAPLSFKMLEQTSEGENA